MNKKVMEAILTLHAEQLPDQAEQIEELLTLASAEREELMALMHLARRLSDILVPVSPSGRFRQRLGEGLAWAMTEAEAKPARSVGLLSRLRHPQPLGLAATASAISVALGLITVIALSRGRTRRPQPASGPLI